MSRAFVGAALALLSAACAGGKSDVGEPHLLAATLRVEAELCGGAPPARATAVLIDTTLAATVAHTFTDDGDLVARSISVFDADGDELGAELAYIDPATDIALLSLDRTGEPLTTGAFSAPDQTSRVVVYADGATEPEVIAIAVVRETMATLDGAGPRRALELGGSVAAGDSGAPVVDDEGRVIGIVFATSTGAERSWAIASSEFEAAAALVERDGAQSTDGVGLSCS